MNANKSPSGRYWSWERIVAECRKIPNSWSVRLPNVPVRLQRTVRDRSAPELRLDDGTIEAELRLAYVDNRGLRRGDLYLRFVPNDQRGPRA